MCNCVSNHQPQDCLLNRLFRRRSKKTSKIGVTGLCVGNSPGTCEFPAQMTSNAENGSPWLRHHANATYISRATLVHIMSIDMSVYPVKLTGTTTNMVVNPVTENKYLPVLVAFNQLGTLPWMIAIAFVFSNSTLDSFKNGLVFFTPVCEISTQYTKKCLLVN